MQKTSGPILSAKFIVPPAIPLNLRHLNLILRNSRLIVNYKSRIHHYVCFIDKTNYTKSTCIKNIFILQNMFVQMQTFLLLQEVRLHGSYKHIIYIAGNNKIIMISTKDLIIFTRSTINTSSSLPHPHPMQYSLKISLMYKIVLFLRQQMFLKLISKYISLLAKPTDHFNLQTISTVKKLFINEANISFSFQLFISLQNNAANFDTTPQNLS